MLQHGNTMQCYKVSGQAHFQMCHSKTSKLIKIRWSMIDNSDEITPHSWIHGCHFVGVRLSSKTTLWVEVYLVFSFLQLNYSLNVAADCQAQNNKWLDLGSVYFWILWAMGKHMINFTAYYTKEITYNIRNSLNHAARGWTN